METIINNKSTNKSNNKSKQRQDKRPTNVEQQEEQHQHDLQPPNQRKQNRSEFQRSNNNTRSNVDSSHASWHQQIQRQPQNHDGWKRQATKTSAPTINDRYNGTIGSNHDNSINRLNATMTACNNIMNNHPNNYNMNHNNQNNYPYPPRQDHRRRITGSPMDQSDLWLRQKYTQCNCKKGNCLKLYCSCYATSLYCTEQCDCWNDSCWNSPQCISKRTTAIVNDLTNDPDSFRKRYDTIFAASTTADATQTVSDYHDDDPSLFQVVPRSYHTKQLTIIPSDSCRGDTTTPQIVVTGLAYTVAATNHEPSKRHDGTTTITSDHSTNHKKNLPPQCENDGSAERDEIHVKDYFDRLYQWMDPKERNDRKRKRQQRHENCEQQFDDDDDNHKNRTNNNYTRDRRSSNYTNKVWTQPQIKQNGEPEDPFGSSSVSSEQLLDHLQSIYEKVSNVKTSSEIENNNDDDNIHSVMAAAENDDVTKIRMNDNPNGKNDVWTKVKDKNDHLDLSYLQCNATNLFSDSSSSGSDNNNKTTVDSMMAVNNNDDNIQILTTLAEQDSILLQETARIIRRQAFELCRKRKMVFFQQQQSEP